MPARNKRPYPPERMVELLSEQKRILLDANGVVTDDDFEIAWELSWAIMVTERAWPHATEQRRAWRKAMVDAMKPEARACFLGRPTGFSRYVGALAEVMDQSMFATREIVVGELVA